MTRLSSMPEIEELLENPSRVADLPPEAARTLFVRLAALQAALTVAVLPAPAAARSPLQNGDRFLDAEEVGAMIGKSRSWVEHNVEELPEPRRVGGERRWSEREIQHWMQACPGWSEQH
jgi:predicted DNA-binding transcriptional regulator AlpA